MRVLLVEDDASTADALRKILDEEGWTVDHAADGQDGQRRALAEIYDVIVADRTMPLLDGLTMLQALRDQGVVTPALVLSALGAPEDRVTGLDKGADDYLAKPYDAAELIARIRALVRRTQYNAHEKVLVIGDLHIRTDSKTALRAGQPTNLTPKEYQLLLYLAQNAGNPVTQRMILENVFNWRAEADPGAPIVPVAISRLRDKIERADLPKILVTLRGKGYLLRDPANER
ncbi:MAG: response regulator transcription factor [Pseudomonadota bacterium]